MIEPIDEAIGRLVAAARRAGQLRADGAVEDMLHALTGMITGWLVQRKLLGLPNLATEEERQAFFDNSWSLFVKGAAADR